MRIFLVSVLAVGCVTAPSLKTYKPDALLPDEGAVVGRVRVSYNGADLTSKCLVCFRSVNGPCYQLDESGFVAMRLQAGACSIRRIQCDNDGERHFHFETATFEVAPAAKTYFGDVAISWKNDQGFKPSQLFGLIGAIVDQSTNDGLAALAVTDSRDEILGWYGGLVKQGDNLPLKQSMVVPVAIVPRVVAAAKPPPPPPARIDASTCAPLIPAKAAAGAAVHQIPDQTSTVLTTLRTDTPVCASATPNGFGLRRVRSVDGVDGFVKDDAVSF
jgi:hypothetical protein